MAELPDDIEQQLREMSDSDWDSLTARLRRPDAAEALREAASELISGDRLDAFCALAHVSAYVNGETGEVDQDKLTGHLRRLFDDVKPPAAAPPAGPRHHAFGQHAPPPPPVVPGDVGIAAAQKRFGGTQPPSRVNAEAQRRFGKGGA